MKKSGHTDVASSLMLCKSIVEDAETILTSLPEEDTELPTWWTNKLAICYAYINSLRDYAVYQGFEEDESEAETENSSEEDSNGETSAEETEMEDEDMMPPSARMMRSAS